MINYGKFKKFKAENQNEWKVYFLVHRKKIVYIGCTNNIRRRLEYHSNYNDPIMKANCKGFTAKKKFTSYRYLKVRDKKKAYNLENKLIKKYMPKYNNHKDYFWKITSKIISSVQPISINGIRTKNRIVCEWSKK